MDLKIVGCSFISLACLSYLVVDYLTYQPTLPSQQIQPSHPAASHQMASLLATEQLVERPTQSASAEKPVLAPQQKLVKEQQVVKTKPVARLSHFDHPRVTGFLNPQGFLRPQWTPETTGLAVSATPLETQRFVVMLDPGHGGSDPGAKSPNGLLEKELTLDIAQRTKLYLSKYPNIEVVFTRDADVGLSRNSRVQKIKRSGADLLLSLHFNDLPQTDVTLVETYYAGGHNIEESRAKQRESGKTQQHNHGTHSHHDSNSFSFTHSSQQLANILQRHVYNEVSAYNSNAENAGVKNDTLFVLTRSYKPGALIEITCLSNPAEAAKLESNEYRNQLSRALANGILEYRRSTTQTGLINIKKTYDSPNLVRRPSATENPEKHSEHSV